MSLAVVIITKNEEKNILRCLESVEAFCDEIIVLDSFSTDRTKDVCSGYSKVKFFERAFDDYIQQKNFANSLVESNYILSLDADEYADSSLQKLIESREYETYGAVQFLRINFIENFSVRYGLWSRDVKIRLWKKELAKWSGSIPHEHIDLLPNTKILNSSAVINHNAYENCQDLVLKAEKYASLAAKNYLTKSVALLTWSMLVNPIFKFFKGYILLQGYKDGKFGWEIAKVSFIETFKKYFYALKLKFQNN